MAVLKVVKAGGKSNKMDKSNTSAMHIVAVTDQPG